VRSAYLTLRRGSVIVRIWLGAQRSSRAVTICASDASSLCQVLLTLCLSDLDLLFFTAASQLFRLEGVLCLELGTTMFWDVAFRHGCEVRYVVSVVSEVVVERSTKTDQILLCGVVEVVWGGEVVDVGWEAD
jgi:hypothetical protein